MNDSHMSTEMVRPAKLLATLSAFELLVRLADNLVVPLHVPLHDELLLTTRAGILYSLVLGFGVSVQVCNSFVGFATVRADEGSVSGVNKLLVPLQLTGILESVAADVADLPRQTIVDFLLVLLLSEGRTTTNRLASFRNVVVNILLFAAGEFAQVLFLFGIFSESPA